MSDGRIDGDCAVVVMWAAAGVAAAVGFTLGHGVGGAEAAAREQRKAAEAGAGRWEVDAATGERRFVYGGR